MLARFGLLYTSLNNLRNVSFLDNGFVEWSEIWVENFQVIIYENGSKI